MMFKLIVTLFIIVFAIEAFIIHTARANDPANDPANDINYINIRNGFKDEITKRVKLLNKMSYTEWVNYNQTNTIIKINDKSYYCFIFEYVEHNDDFIARAHANQTYLHMSWTDIIKDQTENFPFIKEETSPKLIHNMYNTRGSLTDGYEKIIRYHWTDPVELTIIKKESIFDTWHDKHSNKTGVIGIGHNITNMIEYKTMTYSNFIHTFEFIVVNLILILVTSIVYVFDITKTNKIKSLIVFLIISIYIINYISSHELIGSFGTENTKIGNISSSALGMSFLIAANIFILNTLKKEFTIPMFTESSLIFGLSLLLLMLCMFKTTDYITITDLMQDRISTQLIFNMSIILNMIIIINYIIYVIHIQRKKK